MEYIVVTDSEWSDIRAVFQERDLNVTYSVENSGSGGIEYHIHDNLDQVEDILWAIMVLDQVCAGIQEPEPVFSHDGAMPQRSPWRGY